MGHNFRRGLGCAAPLVRPVEADAGIAGRAGGDGRFSALRLRYRLRFRYRFRLCGAGFRRRAGLLRTVRRQACRAAVLFVQRRCKQNGQRDDKQRQRTAPERRIAGSKAGNEYYVEHNHQTSRYDFFCFRFHWSISPIKKVRQPKSAHEKSKLRLSPNNSYNRYGCTD